MADASRTVRVRFDGNANDLRRAADSAGDSLERFARRARLATLGIGTLATAALALGPALLPILSVAAAATVGLSGALGAAGAAAGVFGAVLVGNFAKAKDVIDEVRAAQKRLDAADTTAQRAAAADDLADAQAKLTGNVGKTAAAYLNMAAAWDGFLKKNEPRATAGLVALFSTLALVVPKLQPLFDVAADAAERFFAPIRQAVESGTLDRVVAWAADQAGPALDSLANIARNVGAGLLNMVVGFAPVGQQFLDWVEEVSARFRDWSTQLEPTGSGLGAFIEYVRANTPEVSRLIGEIGSALVTIAQALGPLAPLSLALATGLAGIVNAIPPPVLGGIVVAIVTLNTALAAMNLILLANPIGIWVVAIAGAVAALYALWQTSQTARQVMTEAFSAIGLQLLQFVEIVLQGFGFVVENILSALATIAHVGAAIADALGMDELASKLRTGEEAISNFRDGVQGNFDQAIGKLDEWQGALERMPKTVELKGEIADLERKLERAKADIKKVPPEKQTRLRGEISSLQAKISAAKALLLSVRDRTVTLTVRGVIAASASSAAAYQQRFQGRQFGGPVLPDRHYLVGEKGPELLTMGAGASGHVTPLEKLGDGGPVRLHRDDIAALGEAMARVVLAGIGTSAWTAARSADLYARAG